MWVRDALKTGRPLQIGEDIYPIYEFSARRLREEIESRYASELGEFFSPETTLIPVPKSAPIPPSGAFWPPKELCDALVAAGLALECLPILERVVAVPKSAFSRRGERPKPSQHFGSFRVNRLLGRELSRITLIDDVITKGSTLVAAASRLHDEYPAAEIRAFAMLRTRSMILLEGETPLDPFAGFVDYDEGRDEANRRDR